MALGEVLLGRVLAAGGPVGATHRSETALTRPAARAGDVDFSDRPLKAAGDRPMTDSCWGDSPVAIAQGYRRLVIGLWVGVVGPRAAAAETEQVAVSAVAVAAPQELFLGEPPQVQERLELQLTSGVRWRADRGEPDTAVPLLVELGLTERLQVEVESQVQSVAGPGEAEMTGLEAGLLYAVRSRPPFLVSAGVSAGLAGFSGEEEALAWSVEPTILLQQPVGRLGVNLRLGAERERAFDGGDAEVSAGAALSCFVALSDLYPMLEAAVEASEDETSLVTAAGLAWAPRHGVELGVAVPVQLRPGAIRVGAIAMLTWEMELAEGEP